MTATDRAMCTEAEDRIRELEEAMREYAQHTSWRCEHPPHYYLVERSGGYVGCPCGLDATLRELGLAPETDEKLNDA